MRLEHATRPGAASPSIKVLFARDTPLFQRGVRGDLRTLAHAQPLEKSPPAPLWKRGEPSSFIRFRPGVPEAC